MVVASFLEHLGRNDDAVALLKKVLQTDPNNALALNDLGYYMVEHDDHVEDALVMIQRAVKAEPKNASYLDSLGWAYFKLGKLDEAERYLTNAVGLGSPSATIQEHLGDVYERQGKVEQARATWTKALLVSGSTEQSTRIRSKMSGDSKK